MHNDLYNLMIEKGYPKFFSSVIATELHTEFTAKRMMGYIRARGQLPIEEVADEMFAILSDRDRLINKHISQNAQEAINEWYQRAEADDAAADDGDDDDAAADDGDDDDAAADGAAAGDEERLDDDAAVDEEDVQDV